MSLDTFYSSADLIGGAQLRPVPVHGAVGPLGLLPLLPGLDRGVAPHVGPAVCAGDVEESDALELGALRQHKGLSVTLKHEMIRTLLRSIKSFQLTTISRSSCKFLQLLENCSDVAYSKYHSLFFIRLLNF